MTVQLKVPEVGESVSEVQVGDWLKAEGDRVTQDEVLVTLETDKVTVELPAPTSGVLKKILIGKGETTGVGTVIGELQEAAEPGAKAARPAPARTEPGQKPVAKNGPPAQRSSREKEAGQQTAEQPPKAKPEASLKQTSAARVMPAARRALAEAGLSAEQVSGTGPGGRLLKEDVERHARSATIPSPGTPTPAGDGAAREEEVVRMSPLRKRVAERLVQAQQTAALLTTFNEIDMSEVMALRKQHQEAFQTKYDIKLGFMSFFVKAAVDALKQFPGVNAEVRGDSVAYRNYYDIGVAVGSGKGLVVPVIRNAERLSFAEIERRIADYGARAKNNQLKLEELDGGTFTISNGGVYGSLLSTPIVNPPQSGILGLHAIQERAVVIQGAVVARPMMYVALTYDHRIVDGREAVGFLKRIKEGVETPTRLLLEV